MTKLHHKFWLGWQAAGSRHRHYRKRLGAPSEMRGYKVQVRSTALVGSQSLRTVDVASMVDAVYVDDAVVFVDPIDDAIRADSCAVPAFEFPSEGMPDSLRVGDQAAEAELDDRSYHPW